MDREIDPQRYCILLAVAVLLGMAAICSIMEAL